MDLLNRLEVIDIISVDEWFEMRDLRNEIAHEYENNEEIAINIINSIYKMKNELRKILESISNLIR